MQDKGFFFSPVGPNEALSCGAASHSGSVGFNVLQERGMEGGGGGGVYGKKKYANKALC